MNFLAHTYLVSENDEWILGGIVADLDDTPEDLSSGVQQGIRIHQAIDGYVETHPDFINLRGIFRPVARKYSGVIADMYCDRVLVLNWNEFSDVPVRDFSERVFYLLKNHITPSTTQWEWMRKYITPAWLANYGTDDGMELAFVRLREKALYPDSVPDFWDIHEHYHAHSTEVAQLSLRLLTSLCSEMNSIKNKVVASFKSA